MPQLFQVLRCYKCSVFQVHQTKKSNKWKCKLCGEKQSIKRHYGLGTAKDCRLHVQKLNGMRGDIDELQYNEDLESENIENEVMSTQPHAKTSNYIPIKESKWSNYVEEIEPIEESNNEDTRLGDAEVVLEIPKKRRKLCSNHLKRNFKLPSVDNRKHQENNKYDNVSSTTEPITKNIAVRSIQSNTQQSSLHSEDQIIEKPLKRIDHNIRNKFIPPMVNKNSKWAQFADAEESEVADTALSSSIETSQCDLLFSLCDDTDLDNVLNI